MGGVDTWPKQAHLSVLFGSHLFPNSQS
jgi:hypothetical protein